MELSCQGLPASFYARDTVHVARELLGRRLTNRTHVGCLGGIIVETEAYGPDDPASHAFGGPTRRNGAMFGPAGTAYVYRSYGCHWCLNVVTGPAGVGEAVLIRAIMPTEGLAVMRVNRGVADDRRLCSGPGRLCAALGITGDLDGIDLAAGPLRICADAGPPPEVTATRRIGITRAADRLWRFAVAGSPYVSRRVSNAAR